MVDDARNNRALKSNENQFGYIQKDIFNEISNVLAQKSKLFYFILSNKGKLRFSTQKVLKVNKNTNQGRKI